MRSWKRITAIENSRRLQVLTEFRGLVIKYFNSIKPGHGMGAPIENEAAQMARSEINRLMDDAHKIVLAAGVNPTLTWTPPPMVGGYVHNVDLVINIFNLGRFEISPNLLLDMIDRAFGIYDRNRSAAMVRTFNPLFYFGRALGLLADLPFVAAGRAGMNRQRMEESLLGKLLKLIIYLAGGVASILTILHLMGWLEPLKAQFGV
jgi:hypothetical protein